MLDDSCVALASTLSSVTGHGMHGEGARGALIACVTAAVRRSTLLPFKAEAYTIGDLLVVVAKRTVRSFP